MAGSSDRSKFNHEVNRRRLASSRKATATQAEQERARVQREIARQLKGWTRRRILSWTLFLLAAAVALQHLIAHLGWRPLPMSMGWQDLLVGYPAALLIAVLGAIMLDPPSRRP